MPKRVTIKSIADDLGISHMTVSRALSGNVNVQKATRDAVIKRAQETGYVRSAAASAMRGDQSAIVGLLIPNITNDFYARFANTLAETCDAHGLQLIIHLTKDDFHTEQMALTRLREVQARSVVMVPTPLSDAETNTAQIERSMDVVQVIRERNETDPIGSVLVDDAAAIEKAVAHLRGHGHERIAYIGAPVSLSSGRARLAAFQRGMQAAQISADDRYILTAPPSIAMGERLTQQIMKQTDATALVCGGFEISEGAIKALMQSSYWNAQTDFVGYGDPAYYAWLRGGVTTINVPVDALSKRTIDLIAQDVPWPRGERHRFAASLLVRGKG